jgi:hypothetical protein
LLLLGVEVAYEFCGKPIDLAQQSDPVALRVTDDPPQSGESVRVCGGVRLVASRSGPELRVCGSDSAKYGPPRFDPS